MDIESEYIYSTSLVRSIDQHNKISIPKDIIRDLNIFKDTKMEFLINKNRDIVLRKFVSECDVCGKKTLETHIYKKVSICLKCYIKLTE